MFAFGGYFLHFYFLRCFFSHFASNFLYLISKLYFHTVSHDMTNVFVFFVLNLLDKFQLSLVLTDNSLRKVRLGGQKCCILLIRRYIFGLANLILFSIFLILNNLWRVSRTYYLLTSFRIWLIFEMIFFSLYISIDDLIKIDLICEKWNWWILLRFILELHSIAWIFSHPSSLPLKT